MRRFVPLRPDPRARLARANPVAKLVAAATLMAALFASSGPIAPSVVLVGLASSLPLSGLAPRELLGRSWPLLAAALSVGLLNVLLAPAGPAGPDPVAAAAIGLRLLAITLSGLLAIATTDPTDLADALQQQARLSPRLTLGALAAVRLLPLLAVEWQILGTARRARGITAGWSPIGRARLGFGMLLALLVGATRRATRLATAMEARGFGALACRSVARPQRMRPSDWGLVLAAVGLGLVALVAGSVLRA